MAPEFQVVAVQVNSDILPRFTNFDKNKSDLSTVTEFELFEILNLVLKL